MKRNIFYAAICFAAFLVRSAFGQSGERRWLKATSSKERIYFYSIRDIAKTAPGRVKAWVRTIDKEFDLDAARDAIGREETAGHFYSLQLSEYNCKDRKERILHVTNFDSHGKVIESDGRPTTWRDVSPESVGEELMEVICRAANKKRLSK